MASIVCWPNPVRRIRRLLRLILSAVMASVRDKRVVKVPQTCIMGATLQQKRAIQKVLQRTALYASD